MRKMGKWRVYRVGSRNNVGKVKTRKVTREGKFRKAEGKLRKGTSE